MTPIREPLGKEPWGPGTFPVRECRYVIQSTNGPARSGGVRLDRTMEHNFGVQRSAGVHRLAAGPSASFRLRRPPVCEVMRNHSFFQVIVYHIFPHSVLVVVRPVGKKRKAKNALVKWPGKWIEGGPPGFGQNAPFGSCLPLLAPRSLDTGWSSGTRAVAHRKVAHPNVGKCL